MSTLTILALAAIALLIRVIFRKFGRGWAILVVSIFAIYYLQPALTMRNLDFWLPTATVLIVIVSWWLAANPQDRNWKKILPTLLVIFIVILLIALTRLVNLTGLITPSRPPQLWMVGIALAGAALVIGLLSLLKKPSVGWLAGGIVFIVSILVVIKTPGLNSLAAEGINRLSGGVQSAGLLLDIRWLGFSYIAFRLIHTLRDRQAGRLPDVSLLEYINYVIFFPAVSAGPIDRLERFVKDMRSPAAITMQDLGEGLKRLVVGLFKKFALADSLAIFALNSFNAGQVRTTGWMWVVVYAYTFQIFFDFSGYTDIAIGIGRWLGFRLPENFEHPYLKSNLTMFWNSWHITLTQWFRAYFFNPVTRWLRSAKKPLQTWAIILIAQTGTMLLIGAWHGITWNFLAWCIWHAVGLFIHNRWSEWLKPQAGWFDSRPRLKTGLKILGVVATFQYVALGWVWFALPSLQSSFGVFAKLLGAS